jgi:L-aminopeptidase/D-esterase-like protein
MPSLEAPAYEGGLTDVAGLRVGHFTHTRRPTGCTVVLAESGAVCGVDVRGGAPGTRETDLLDPINLVERVHAVVLSGGSAFGLDVASGVVRWLEARGIGFAAGNVRVPIVPSAILFDLGLGDPSIRPDADAGLAACDAASAGPVAEGSVGAGAGATVGKLLGSDRAMKGGIGSAALRLEGNVVVAALAAVNAAGDVFDPDTSRLVAGARSVDGRKVEGCSAMLRRAAPRVALSPRESTTLGVVATNVALDKAMSTKVAQMAQDGLARAIRPAHTPWDGDTVFAMSTGKVRLEHAALVVGCAAAEAVSRAVVRAMLCATGAAGFPALRDLHA